VDVVGGVEVVGGGSAGVEAVGVLCVLEGAPDPL
jgi:hypothetical protein